MGRQERTVSNGRGVLHRVRMGCAAWWHQVFVCRGWGVCAAFFRGVFGACVCLPLCGVSAALCIVLPVLAWCTAAPGRGVQILRELPENPSHHAPFTHGKFLNPIFVHSGFMKMKNQIFFTQR